MDMLREISRWSHVVFGFVGLVAFWFPVFAKKGGRLHVRAGKVFTACGYGVTASAFLSCGLLTRKFLGQGLSLREQPEAFSFLFLLAYLAIVTFASIRQGVRVVETKKNPAAIATAAHLATGWASIFGSFALLAFALIFRSSQTPLLLGLSPIGVLVGRSILRYASHPPQTPREWFYEHMGALLGAGIAFHTAFAVFGAQRMFGFETQGFWAFVPWFLPAAVGVPVSFLWERRYRRRFGDLAPAAEAVA